METVDQFSFLVQNLHTKYLFTGLLYPQSISLEPNVETKRSMLAVLGQQARMD